MTKPWQRRYPILIFDVDAATVDLAVNGASAGVSSAKSTVDQAASQLETAKEQLKRSSPTERPYWQKKVEDAEAAVLAASQQVASAQNRLKQAKEAQASEGRKAHLYWMESSGYNPKSMITALQDETLIPRTYSTDKVLVIACRASFGDGSNMASTVINVNGGGTLETEGYSPLRREAAPPTTLEVNRLYALDAANAANSSDMLQVAFSVKSPDFGQDVFATAILERHRVIFFSAGGGVLFTRATSPTYASNSVETTISTTTTVSTTTTTNGTQTGTTTSSTTATSAGTASYAFGTEGPSWQMNGIAGVTWYPFGRDTFPVSGRHGFATSYGQYSPKGSFGMFVGTSVTNLGYFTVGPAYEVFPGVQILAASTWWSKTRLQKNVVACAGYGTSPSFSYPPSSTQTQSTSSTSGGTTTVTTTTTTETSTVVTGCANGNKATILAGTTVPTVSDWKPAFSMGVIFNTNLFKAFSGIGK